MVLKYYYDLMSQPARALYILLKLSKTPFEPCKVSLGRGQHLTDEFKEKSRFQKVPFIHDGDFKLTENIAIVRYLSREYQIPEQWYPKESKEQAKVDEYLEWQHNNTRIYCALYFRTKWMLPLVTGKEADPKQVEFMKKNMIKCLDEFQDLWLSQGHTFIVGDRITYADILAACEIEQPRVAGYDPTVGRPVLRAWLDKVKSECNPYYDEAHKVLNKLAASSEIPQAKL